MGYLGVRKDSFKKKVSIMVEKICYECRYGATSVNLCIKHMKEIPRAETCDAWKYFDLDKELHYNMTH